MQMRESEEVRRGLEEILRAPVPRPLHDPVRAKKQLATLRAEEARRKAKARQRR